MKYVPSQECLLEDTRATVFEGFLSFEVRLVYHSNYFLPPVLSPIPSAILDF